MMIPGYVLNALSQLSANGFEAFVVGGCVRDLLLGNSPSDWDITTSATPEEMMGVFEGYSIIPTGLKHGTLTIISEGHPLEITTYRIDGEYLDNRHPDEVAFTRSLAKDLSRRDFTINAMAYNPEQGLKDIFGGQSDLENRIIRCVGESSRRFSEDALRIIRGLRFAAVLGFKINSETKTAMRTLAPLLSNIAKERIFPELSKLLLSENPKFVLTEFPEIFSVIFGFDINQNLALWQKNASILSALPKNLALRLAILLYGLKSAEESEPIVDAFLKNMNCSNEIHKEVKLFSLWLSKKIKADRICLKQTLRLIGVENLTLLTKGQAAKGVLTQQESEMIFEILDYIERKNECFSLDNLALNGSELKNRFNLSGPKIGEILNMLLDAVISGDCENNNPELIEYAGRFYLNN